MKLGSFLFLAALSLSTSLFASDLERDKLMWERAYEGDLMNVYVLANTREVEDLNDELLNFLVMAYVSYRMGDCEEMDDIFNGVDYYIEHSILK